MVRNLKKYKGVELTNIRGNTDGNAVIDFNHKGIGFYAAVTRMIFGSEYSHIINILENALIYNTKLDLVVEKTFEGKKRNKHHYVLQVAVLE